MRRKGRVKRAVNETRGHSALPRLTPNSSAHGWWMAYCVGRVACTLRPAAVSEYDEKARLPA